MKSERSSISFRPIKPGEETCIVNLVLSAFSEFAAPGFSDEGILEFKKFVTESALSERLKSGNPVVVAQLNEEIIGMAEIRDNSHLALLFVQNAYQKKGIAKRLLHEAVNICKERNPDIQKITVNSSPNAYEAYRQMGFAGEETEKTVNGIRFIPMALRLGRNG